MMLVWDHPLRSTLLVYQNGSETYFTQHFLTQVGVWPLPHKGSGHKRHQIALLHGLCRADWRRSSSRNSRQGHGTERTKARHTAKGPFVPPQWLMTVSLPWQDSSPDDGEARHDFWSISGNDIHRHHVEPRVKLCSPSEDYDTLTSPELQERIWMLCKIAASTIIGTSKGTEIYQTRGQVSHDSKYLMNGRHVRCSATKRNTKVGCRIIEVRQCKKVQRYLFSSIHQMWSSRKPEKVGSSDASSYAMQDQVKKVQGDL